MTNEPAKTAETDLAPEEKSTRRERRSIANDHPQELLEIGEKNQVVAEVLDLFSGSVVDIHR